MKRLTFWKVLKSNLKCAFCRVEHCPVRYMPERRNIQHADGSRYVTRCKKDQEADLMRIVKRKLP